VREEPPPYALDPDAEQQYRQALGHLNSAYALLRTLDVGDTGYLKAQPVGRLKAVLREAEELGKWVLLVNGRPKC
jgi:hypothetical protein